MNKTLFNPQYAGAINFLMKGGHTLQEAQETVNEYATKALRLENPTQGEVGSKIQKNFRAFIEWNKIYQREKRLQKNNPFKVQEGDVVGLSWTT